VLSYGDGIGKVVLNGTVQYQNQFSFPRAFLSTLSESANKTLCWDIRLRLLSEYGYATVVNGPSGRSNFSEQLGQ
jgi:hypothetical protein